MTMEWPKELLELFDDPLLADVHPKAQTPTADERMIAKLQEVAEWVESNGREPRTNGGSLKEKLLAASLQAFQTLPEKEALKAYDRLNLIK